MSMPFGYRSLPNPQPPEMVEARNRVFSACKSAGIAFSEGSSPDRVTQSIDEGVRICAGRWCSGSGQGRAILHQTYSASLKRPTAADSTVSTLRIGGN